MPLPPLLQHLALGSTPPTHTGKAEPKGFCHILIAGDADFVPAAKLARREGIDFVLDPLGHPIKEDLFEHIDGKRSCGNPYVVKKTECKKVPAGVK